MGTLREGIDMYNITCIVDIQCKGVNNVTCMLTFECCRNHVVFSDGLQQEITSIDIGIQLCTFGSVHRPCIRKRCSFHVLNQTFTKACGALSQVDGGVANLAKRTCQFICDSAETHEEWQNWYIHLTIWLHGVANHYQATCFPPHITAYIDATDAGKFSNEHCNCVIKWMENNVLKNSSTISLYGALTARTFGQVATVCESEMSSAKSTGRLSRTTSLDGVVSSELK